MVAVRSKAQETAVIMHECAVFHVFSRVEESPFTFLLSFIVA